MSYYFNPKPRFERLKSLRKFLIEKKASKICFNALEMTFGTYQEMGNQDKQKLADSLKSFEELMKDKLQEEALNIDSLDV